MREQYFLQKSLGEELSWFVEPRRHTVAVGSFPCQNISVAGRREGIDGKQSRLWRDYLDIIGATLPDWVVTENSGHTWRAWVPKVRRELWLLGYSSLPLRVRASDLGASHQRSRVFIVANPDSELIRKFARWWTGPGREVAKELARSWDYTPRRLGTDDGLSDWMDRRHGLGNSVVPQIAEVIATGIKKIDPTAAGAAVTNKEGDIK